MNKIIPPQINTSDGRVGLSQPISSGRKKRPVFCFRYVHPTYALDQLEKLFAKPLLKRFQDISNEDWDKLLLRAKTSGGPEAIPIKQISPPPISNFREDVLTPEVKSLWSIRFKGNKARIIGYYSNSVFHVLYVDTKLKVYKHGS